MPTPVEQLVSDLTDALKVNIPVDLLPTVIDPIVNIAELMSTAIVNFINANFASVIAVDITTEEGESFSSDKIDGKTVVAMIMNDTPKSIGFTQDGTTITFTDGTTVIAGMTIVFIFGTT